MFFPDKQNSAASVEDVDSIQHPFSGERNNFAVSEEKVGAELPLHTLILAKKQWEDATMTLKSVENGDFVPRKVRNFFRDLICELEKNNLEQFEEVLSILEKPPTICPHISRQIRMKIFEVVMKWQSKLLAKAQLVDSPCSSVLLNDGELNRAFLFLRNTSMYLKFARIGGNLVV